MTSMTESMGRLKDREEREDDSHFFKFSVAVESTPLRGAKMPK